MFKCVKCELKFATFSKLCTHIGSSHTRLIFACGIDGCQRTFANALSYKTHGYRNHGNVVQHPRSCIRTGLIRGDSLPEDQAMDTLSNNEDVEPSVVEAAIESISSYLQNEQQLIGSSTTAIAELQIGLAKCITDTFVTVRELHMLPNSTARAIFMNFRSIVELMHEKYSDIFNSVLTENNLQLEALSEPLSGVLQDSSFVTNLFCKTNSDYLVNKHIKDKMPYSEPETKQVGVHMGKKLFATYVSIRKVVTKMLSQNGFLAETMYYAITDKNVDNYIDFKDGSSWNLPPPKLDNGKLVIVIPLLMYSDEFELCNPIGPSKKKHKLSAYCYILPCVPPKYRSTVNFTQLACLVKDITSKLAGVSNVLKPMIDELQSLWTHPIQLDDVDAYVKLIAISSDNLTAHSLAGFQQTFASGKFCRHCYVTYGEHRTMSRIDVQMKRT